MKSKSKCNNWMRFLFWIPCSVKAVFSLFFPRLKKDLSWAFLHPKWSSDSAAACRVGGKKKSPTCLAGHVGATWQTAVAGQGWTLAVCSGGPAGDAASRWQAAASEPWTAATTGRVLQAVLMAWDPNVSFIFIVLCLWKVAIYRLMVHIHQFFYERLCQLPQRVDDALSLSLSFTALATVCLCVFVSVCALHFR